MSYAVDGRGVRISYTEHSSRGAGPAVLMLQGLSLSSRFWFELPTKIASLGFRVITCDNRGTGQSDVVKRPLRMKDLADDAAMVLRAADAGPAYVVGISLGGMIAQELAILHPSLVRGLVLAATTPGLPHGALPTPRALSTLLRMPFLKGKEANLALLRLLLPVAEHGNAKELFKDWPKAMAESPRRPATFFAQLGAATLHSTGTRLGALRCPTVVITGDEDALIPSKNSRVIAGRIRGAKLEVLKGVGHAIPAQDPAIFGRALRTLVESQQ